MIWGSKRSYCITVSRYHLDSRYFKDIFATAQSAEVGANNEHTAKRVQFPTSWRRSLRSQLYNISTVSGWVLDGFIDGFKIQNTVFRKCGCFLSQSPWTVCIILVCACLCYLRYFFYARLLTLIHEARIKDRALACCGSSCSTCGFGFLWLFASLCHCLVLWRPKLPGAD